MRQTPAEHAIDQALKPLKIAAPFAILAIPLLAAGLDIPASDVQLRYLLLYSLLSGLSVALFVYRVKASDGNHLITFFTNKAIPSPPVAEHVFVLTHVVCSEQLIDEHRKLARNSGAHHVSVYDLRTFLKVAGGATSADVIIPSGVIVVRDEGLESDRKGVLSFDSWAHRNTELAVLVVRNG